MKLRDFIRETMVEIAHGIHLAKVETKDLWAITPESIDGERVGEKSFVSFDVAVTVNDSSQTEKDGKGGAKAEIEVLGSKLGAELGGGISGKTEHAMQSVSRISFQVPVYMTAHYRGNKEIAEEIAFYTKTAAKPD